MAWVQYINDDGVEEEEERKIKWPSGKPQIMRLDAAMQSQEHGESASGSMSDRLVQKPAAMTNQHLVKSKTHPPMSEARSGAEATPAEKRKRGRPRKNPLPATGKGAAGVDATIASASIRALPPKAFQQQPALSKDGLSLPCATADQPRGLPKSRPVLPASPAVGRPPSSQKSSPAPLAATLGPSPIDKKPSLTVASAPQRDSVLSKLPSQLPVSTAAAAGDQQTASGSASGPGKEEAEKGIRAAGATTSIGLSRVRGSRQDLGAASSSAVKPPTLMNPFPSAEGLSSSGPIPSAERRIPRAPVSGEGLGLGTWGPRPRPGLVETPGASVSGAAGDMAPQVPGPNPGTPPADLDLSASPTPHKAGCSPLGVVSADSPITGPGGKACDRAAAAASSGAAGAGDPPVAPPDLSLHLRLAASGLSCVAEVSAPNTGLKKVGSRKTSKEVSTGS